MSQNTLENQKQGFGLERPGQFYDRPQTYRELDGANPYQSFMPPVDPGILLGTEEGRVEVRPMPAPIPDDRLHRNPKTYEDVVRPEFELTQFRGQGDPPPLPEDPAKWEDIDWRVYFEWVSTNPAQMQLLQQTYEMLQTHYKKQG